MRKSQVIGLGIILVFAAFGAGAFMKSLTPYVSFGEARAAAASVQVKGALDRSSIQVDRKTHDLVFNLVDEKGDRMTVVYGKPEPGNFRQASEVVAVGRYNGSHFEAENLLVKCPSKYQGMGEKHPENVRIPASKP